MKRKKNYKKLIFNWMLFILALVSAGLLLHDFIFLITHISTGLTYFGVFTDVIAVLILSAFEEYLREE